MSWDTLCRVSSTALEVNKRWVAGGRREEAPGAA